MRLTDPRISHLSHRLRNALQQLVLPGFGSFTGSKPVAPQKSDRIFALTGAEVREIPPTLFANRTK